MTDASQVRSFSQVRQQLKQVMFRHLQKELKDNFKETPETCFYNHQTTINGSVERIGVCRFDTSILKDNDGIQSPRGKVCDNRVAGCALQARTCRCWYPTRTKDEIKNEFRKLMASDRGVIAARYPDVAALMWVIDGVDFTEEIRMAEIEADPPGVI